MANQTLLDDYRALSVTNLQYGRNRDRWQFLYESYIGGEEYRRAGHLTKYQLETSAEYQARLLATPLDNHCASVINTYMSFLFRKEPERDLKDWELMPELSDFLKDCDYEGRSFDAFMKQVAIWSSVFGSCWVIMTKPNVNAQTALEEQVMGARPYVNLVTPLVVSDWTWTRNPNGKYDLTYLKYVEEVLDKVTVVKVWYLDRIETWHMDDKEKTAELMTIEPNQLGVIPAVLVYNQRGVVKGIGVSDITDIADVQKMIYNLQSENEQAIRLDGHPSLVVPPTAQLGSGAGAVIMLQEGSDPGLNPYYLESNGISVDNIHKSIDKLVEAIDRMANTGGVRGTETKTQSGVAMEVEFQLLNARLSEKADNLELAEEQLWRLFGLYQNREFNGEISYPDNFSIRDMQREFQQLQQAKAAATDPRVLQVIDHELVELLGEDPDVVLPFGEYLPPAQLPARPEFEPHLMIDPNTGEERIARTEQEHLELANQGWVHKEED